MSGAIQLGPLLLPLTLLLVIASAAATLALGRWLSKGSKDVDATVWHVLLAAVVVARLAFVYEYRDLYWHAPLSIIDVRDGGWNPTAGLIGAWLLALHRQRGMPAQGRPLRWALATGSAIFLVGSAVLAVGTKPRQQLPDLAFTSLPGEAVSLARFAGKPTVINLWATWCPPCVREMPVLHEAQRTRTDVHIVFLNQGEEAGHVSRWLESRRLPLGNVLLDPRRQASATFKQQGYPTTLFFDARGELVSVRIGELSAATLAEKLKLLTR